MKKVLLLLLSFCFVLNTTSVYAAPIPQGSDYTLPQCEEINEAQLRVELKHVIQEFLADETKIDFVAIVNRQWYSLNLDSVIDSEIDNAVNAVNNNAGFANRFKSSWIPSKAEELASDVTEIAFNSPALKGKLTQLSKNVAEEISDKLEVASAKSSSYAIDCLQQFVNRQYSQTFVNIFSKKIKASTPSSEEVLESLRPDTVQFINRHKFGIAGSAVLVTAITARVNKKIVSTVVNRIFQQVGERVLGRIGSGFIPVIGEVVGGLLLAGDLINSFDGALPEIQKSLKSLEVKQTLRKGIANTVEEEIRSESSQIAGEISNDIYAEWLDFQKDYRDTLSLAGELPEFQEILSKTTDLSKISLLVGIALNNMGRNQLVTSIQDGTFERALSLPEISFKILETSNSLPTVVAWTNLAGNQIDDVVKLELYKHLSPQDLDRQFLIEILSLEDDLTISKLSLLDVNSIRDLLAVSKQNLTSLSAHLSIDDLKRLAGYLRELEQPKVNQLVKFLLNDDPSIIKNSAVMAHIIQSHDINAAIRFWETSKSPFLALDGMLKILKGAISLNLVADKYGFPVLSLFIGLPIFLFLALIIWFYNRWVKVKQIQKSLGETNANQSGSSTGATS
jgi:hypothetical protein